MKIKELKLKSEKEWPVLLQEYRDKERDLRFKISTKQTKNIREIRQVRKTIAQLLSLINQAKKQSINKPKQSL